MALFGAAKSLSEGFFHVLVLATAIYLAINGKASYGDVLTFSCSTSTSMAPLTEIHRVLDEGHEASLRVGDLLEMLGEPVDPSFHVHAHRLPRLVSGEPVIEVENLKVEYATPLGQTFCALHGVSLTIRHGETIGVAGRSGGGKSTWIKALLRLDHRLRGEREGGRRAAGGPVAGGHRQFIRLRRSDAVRVRRHHCRQHRLRQRERHLART